MYTRLLSWPFTESMMFLDVWALRRKAHQPPFSYYSSLFSPESLGIRIIFKASLISSHMVCFLGWTSTMSKQSHFIMISINILIPSSVSLVRQALYPSQLYLRTYKALFRRVKECWKVNLLLHFMPLGIVTAFLRAEWSN